MYCSSKSHCDNIMSLFLVHSNYMFSDIERFIIYLIQHDIIFYRGR